LVNIPNRLLVPVFGLHRKVRIYAVQKMQWEKAAS
jgi:hypothetical protein